MAISPSRFGPDYMFCQILIFFYQNKRISQPTDPVSETRTRIGLVLGTRHIFKDGLINHMVHRPCNFFKIIFLAKMLQVFFNTFNSNLSCLKQLYVLSQKTRCESLMKEGQKIKPYLIKYYQTLLNSNKDPIWCRFNFNN